MRVPMRTDFEVRSTIWLRILLYKKATGRSSHQKQDLHFQSRIESYSTEAQMVWYLEDGSHFKVSELVSALQAETCPCLHWPGSENQGKFRLNSELLSLYWLWSYQQSLRFSALLNFVGLMIDITNADTNYFSKLHWAQWILEIKKNMNKPKADHQTELRRAHMQLFSMI